MSWWGGRQILMSVGNQARTNSGETPAAESPDAPSGLAAAQAGKNQLNLSWDAYAGSADYLSLERSPSGAGTWTEVARTNPGATAHRDFHLNAATTYDYRLRARSAGGNSGYSTDSGTTQAADADPAAPINVSVSARGGEALVVAWEQPDDLAYDFLIWVHTASTGFPTDPSYNPGGDHRAQAIRGLTAGTTRYVKMVARRRDESSVYHNSPESSVASGTTGSATASPGQPTSLVATAASPRQVNLAWAYSGTDHAGFQIERAPDSGGSPGTWAVVGYVGRDERAFVDTGYGWGAIHPTDNPYGDGASTKNALAPATTYHWRIKAVNIAGVAGTASTSDSEATAAARASYTISGSHPRVWLNSSRVTAVIAAKDANTAAWQKVLITADEGLGVATAWANRPYIAQLCLAYVATGDTDYADKAIALADLTLTNSRLLEYDEDGPVSGGATYEFRYDMHDLATCYDWCYDRLTSGQKTAWAVWMMDRCYDLWPELNGYDTDPESFALQWSVNDPGNNYYLTYIACTWGAALAAYGDDARATTVVDLMIKKWDAQLRHFFSTNGVGGSFDESYYYDHCQYAWWALDAHKTATGQDLFNEAGLTFDTESALARYHQAMPGRQYRYAMGDQPSSAPPDLQLYDRAKAYILMANTSNTTLRDKLRDYLDKLAAAGVVTGRFVSQYTVGEVIYYDTTGGSASDYTSGLATDHYLSGHGLQLRRTGWGSTATAWGCWMGPLYASHQDDAFGQLMIWRGGWLLANGSVWSSQTGVVQSTSVHNTVHVGDEPGYIPTRQQKQASANPTWPSQNHVVTRDLDTDYCYLKGDGTQGFVQDRGHDNRDPAVFGGNAGPLVSEWVREVVALSGDCWVVLDRVTCPNTALEKKANYHLPTSAFPSVVGRTWVATNGSSYLAGAVTNPAAATVNVIGQKIINANSDPDVTVNSHRLTVTAPTGNATDHLLVGLIATDTAQTAPVSVEVTVGDALAIRLGTWVCVLNKTDTALTAITYRTTSPPVDHLVCGLTPSATYDLTVRNSGGGTVRTDTVTASAAGVVRFTDSTSGAYSFTLD